jgi:ABC-type multidrug transport system ATPase subunit
MTCNRVAIINEGKLVKIDTPDNLTTQLRGSESILLEVEGPVAEVQAAFSQHNLVTAVSAQPGRRDDLADYKVEAAVVRYRRDLPPWSSIGGWGLLERNPKA